MRNGLSMIANRLIKNCHAILNHPVKENIINQIHVNSGRL